MPCADADLNPGVPGEPGRKPRQSYWPEPQELEPEALSNKTVRSYLPARDEEFSAELAGEVTGGELSGAR